MFFEPEKATSVEKDYHGLPVTLLEEPPEWMANAEVEREIYLETPSGRELSDEEKQEAESFIHGVFLHAPEDCPAEDCPLADREVTFLYQHGNSGHIFRYWYRAVALWSMGANVFIYNYRGYGLSSGKPSRKNVLEDASAAMAFVKGRDDVNPERIIAYGYSMGGIPTSYLAGRSAHKNDFFAAALESALDSPDETLNLSMSTELPGGFFMDDALFDGPTFIADAPLIPILHIHGSKDERVVIEQAEQYYKALEDRENYTHYLGKEDKAHEDWVKASGHRNVPIASFKADRHISDYYDDDPNPSHCCIHSIEYSNAASEEFLESKSKTSPEQITEDAARYRALVSDWVLSILP